jgi:hypothetical protein
MESMLKELVWNPSEVATLPKLLLSLGLAALLGQVLAIVYVRFGHALSNRRSFARNFLLLAVTTTLIISIVKSSLALSLGLVGALSIVRFRAAIKEPEELAFLFLAISVGLGMGAGQVMVTVVAVSVILVLVVLRGAARGPEALANLYLTVTSPGPGRLSAGQILAALEESGVAASLKRFDETPDALEAAFLVDFKGVGAMEKFTQRMRGLSEGVRISCLEEHGLGA